MPILEKENYEADDIIGTVSRICGENSIECYIATGDRDDLQLAGNGTTVVLASTKMGRSVTELFDEGAVKEKYGVTPLQFIDVKALMGDSSDNIPGVPKVGEKTAISLIQEFGSIDGIYENIDSVGKPAIKTSLAENKETAYFCQKLVTIITDAPLPITLEDALIGDFYNENSLKYIKEFELKSFLSRFDTSSMSAKPEVTVGCFESLKDAESELAEVLKTGRIGVKFRFLTNEEKKETECAGEQLSLFDAFSANASSDAKSVYLKAAAVSSADKTVAFLISTISGFMIRILLQSQPYRAK